MGMTKKEVEAIIKKEKRYIERLKAKIEDIRFDISATKKSIDGWKTVLKGIEADERKAKRGE